VLLYSHHLLPDLQPTEAGCVPQGGPITQVEQEEMALILSEAKADASKSGVTLSTSLVTMEYCVFLERYGGK
jgi:hypothetical protein